MGAGDRPEQMYGVSRRAVLRLTGAAAVAAGIGVAFPGAAGAADADADAAAVTKAFTPGQPWLDDAGNVIQAHGGQVFAVPKGAKAGKGVCYLWYGEDRSNGYYNSPGVHVYSSSDLYTWHDEGLALKAMESADQFTTDPYFADLYGDYTADQQAAVYRDLGTKQVSTTVNPAILERPKVIYNHRTRQWVMWVHADGPSGTSNAQYAKARAGVAVSDSPYGPFRWIDSYRLDVAPAGEDNYQPDNPGMARDMNLFVDDDGTAYIIYSSEENYSLFISKLDADYTYLSAPPDQAVKGVDFIRPYIGAHREAPALFRFGDVYYLITSGATGWTPNPAQYATATDILGEWTDHGSPISGDGAADTFTSQSTCVIPVEPKRGRFIFMGDRWTPSDLANSPYIWLPVSFGEGTSMELTWHDSWTLDADLPEQKQYTVDAQLPAQLWLGADGAAEQADLPSRVRVTCGHRTLTSRVTWNLDEADRPGLVPVTGTLLDFGDRAFTRQVLAVPHNLRYVVNAGGDITDDWTSMVTAARTEGTVLNSTPEQALGSDAETGAQWGWTSQGALARKISGGDLYTTLRYAVSGRTLTYTFGGLDPARTYTVHAGWYDPWPWANRAARVEVNGTVVEAQRLFTSTREASAYRGLSPDANGVLRLDVIPTRSPDIQLSFALVSEDE
ncbi:glycoside hydrolase family 43 protein [Streptomyces sp. NPDC002088]|uniref:glycoside hydrolase family 43 protein n=1 Tax=Streptomyces sp. NPDC002088 TaxID=3154665 RepID=UPI003324797B